jgi:hypothetical protein
VYTPKTKNRLSDADNDELMGVIQLPSRMGLGPNNEGKIVEEK